MGMTTVYDTIYDYLTPENSNITYLGAVYPALPKISNEEDLFSFSPPGTGVGAIIYEFITAKSETRIALGGPHDGRKWVPYTLSLLCILKSDLPEAKAGQAAFNQFVDSLTDRVRAARNGGNPNFIFQWGEGGVNGGPDIDFQFY